MSRYDRLLGFVSKRTMPPKAKAKAKAKRRRALAIDKYAQMPGDMQAAARLLDDRDLVKRTQKALGERHARDDRIDYVPAGGEQVEALAEKVEDIKKHMKAMGGTVRSVSTPRSRSPRRGTFGSSCREHPVNASTSRAMGREPFRAPSLEKFAGMAAKRSFFRDARVAAARTALRGRRPT